MVQVEIDVTIQRPIEEVFEQLVDIPRYSEWTPSGGLLIPCTNTPKAGACRHHVL